MKAITTIFTDPEHRDYRRHLRMMDITHVEISGLDEDDNITASICAHIGQYDPTSPMGCAIIELRDQYRAALKADALAGHTLGQNKMIARFMGVSSTCDIWDTDGYRGKICLVKGLDTSDVDAEISHFEDRYGVTCEAIATPLEYHISWDWLMPVVEKCFDVAHAAMQEDDFFEISGSLPDMGKTYIAVVNFIIAQKL
ncbi:MAG: hypothetical protein P8J32_06310 [bacterium]|nr:hypothetical protein [bacterium]